jgi:hypothetical protein
MAQLGSARQQLGFLSSGLQALVGAREESMLTTAIFSSKEHLLKRKVDKLGESDDDSDDNDNDDGYRRTSRSQSSGGRPKRVR